QTVCPTNFAWRRYYLLRKTALILTFRACFRSFLKGGGGRNDLTHASSRPRADRHGAEAFQEADRAQRRAEGVARAPALREAERVASPRPVAQGKGGPQGPRSADVDGTIASAQETPLAAGRPPAKPQAAFDFS